MLEFLLVPLMFAAGFDVEVPAFAKAWDHAPARLEVESGVHSARVIDIATGSELPCKVQQKMDKRYLYWVRSDDGQSTHRYRIVINEQGPGTPPVFVGAGDRLSYGRERVVQDLSAGLWAVPMPVDWDQDGDWDLIYNCDDRQMGGVYIYLQVKENLFERIERIGQPLSKPALADLNGDGNLDMMQWHLWFDHFREKGFSDGRPLLTGVPENAKGYTARQVDWDGDGKQDLLTGGSIKPAGDPPQEYDAKGHWLGGAPTGRVWFLKNTGTNAAPEYAEPVALLADGKPLDVYGTPYPCAADWDGDGDLDLLVNEFREEFIYYENVGERTNPRLDRPQVVYTKTGPLHVEETMPVPMACDWNKDGMMDIVVGQEDGRVSVMLQTGLSRGAPEFDEEFFLKEIEGSLKTGALARPWLDAKSKDLYGGNAGGYIWYFDWLGDEYADGVHAEADGVTLRIQAGSNLSPQGPGEAKWGYTVPTLGDVDGDGVEELVYNSAIGHIMWHEILDGAKLGPANNIRIAWDGEPLAPDWNWWQPGAEDLVVQWRTRPLVLDWNGDGKDDLIAQDHEGYLALYAALGDGLFAPGARVFLDEAGQPLRLNERTHGKSGRSKIDLADWDGDGDLDLLRNSENTGWFEQADGAFVWRGELVFEPLGGHSTAPQAYDWDGDGQLDLLVGAEDGHFYCYHRGALESPKAIDAVRAE